MKIKYALAMAALLAAPVSVAAMDSHTLQDHPEKYRPVYASEKGVVYADVDTIQLGDPIPGQLPMLQADLYAEVYEPIPTYDNISAGNLVQYVFAYRTKLLAVHKVKGNTEKLAYYIDNRLTATYDKEGNPATARPIPGMERDPFQIGAEAEDLYLNLYRQVGQLRIKR